MDKFKNDEAANALTASLLNLRTSPTTPTPPAPVAPAGNKSKANTSSTKTAKTAKTDTKKSSKTSSKSASKNDALTPPSAPPSAPPASAYDRWTLKPETSISYGSSSKNLSPSSPKPFYLTTAINYANGPAHMGHAYEGISADIITRYHRLKSGAYFLTGSDEHGQKIAGVAEKNNLKPIEICDKYVTGFQVLNQRGVVSNDDYLRTTDERHIKTCQKLWNMAASKDDIYLGHYEGWYNIREETFITEADAEATNYKDPTTGAPLTKTAEESYFFKMSKYQGRLVEWLKSGPVVQPEGMRNFIIKRLEEPLRDLSISRTTFDWGIPVPEGFKEKHVMYVWFDALTNYLTGSTGSPSGGPGIDASGKPGPMWPCDLHLIGKDIIWFHSVIWPCMLMSVDIELPKCIYAHGFINDKEGKKMSKSIGNVIDPHDVLDKFPTDCFRWYLAKEAPFGGELSFSEENMGAMYNSDLCDTMGNLVHRATNLCKKYCGGVVPEVPLDKNFPVDVEGLRRKAVECMDKFAIDGLANLAISVVRDVNKYLTDSAPWLLKGEENDERRKVIVKTSLECIYIFSHFLAPFLVTACDSIFDKLSTPPVGIDEIKVGSQNIKNGTEIKVGDVLYTKFVSEEEKNAEESKKKKANEIASKQKKKKEEKARLAKKSVEYNTPSNSNQSEFTKIEIRVGQIQKVWNHPAADKLFCEEINMGGEVRNIASGLREFYTLEEMENRKVLVVCNLKSSKIVGFESQGMVLAAKCDSKTVLLNVPDSAEIGERVFIEGLEGEPFSSQQVKKKKTWASVQKDLKCDGEGKPKWEGEGGGVLRVKSGECVGGLAGGVIS
ncbi:hypothetical protein TL16_g09463 [Triparma laevis f. inornata]|uniref:methionine--tRNA ligase n=1 Tax=Triparma laevis f. inornata TaxID=1714386 RepID=A0A9W7EMX3_9STRA|nr:hypothetical protein TL16_g09463 [Triparma laevis f. inornata]